MLKKLLFISLISYSFVFSANVYLLSPEHGETRTLIYWNSSVSINYEIQIVNQYFSIVNYSATLTHPDGSKSFAYGRSGGWNVDEPGSYYVTGVVYVVQDMDGGGDYYMYSINREVVVYDNRPNPLEGVTISGPGTMYNEGNCFYYANLTEGIGPFTYTWQKQMVGSISFFGPIVLAAPSNQWITIGNSSSLSLSPPTNGDWRDFKLRCIVYDQGSSVTKTSSEFYVSVNNVSPPSSKIVSSNQKNVEYSLASREIVPKEYSLFQNYPNPFNPTTTISFSLPLKTNVKLTVYNMMGEEIETLVNSIKEQGVYKVEFDANNISSGTYIYRLETNTFSECKKMILLK